MIGFLSVLLVDKHCTVNNIIATLAPVSPVIIIMSIGLRHKQETSAVSQAWLNCHTVFS